MAKRLWDLPLLAQALKSGEISFDKAQVAVTLATPHTEARVLRQARQSTVRQLHDLARRGKGTSDDEADRQHQRRYLRFTDDKRTMSVQLPGDHYALVRDAITGVAKLIPSDGTTPYDQRLCDALIEICRDAMRRGHGRQGQGQRAGGADGRGGGGDGEDGHGGSGDVEWSWNGSGRPLVVAHADLALLRGGTGTAELVSVGLLSPEAARRLTCDADVALAIDDAFGHTMCEGRARRFPSAAQRREVQRRDRHCRFPGCANSLFTHVHHIVHWADGGVTDLENLALLCDHHHHKVHESKWQMSGNANGILRFLGPTKRLMTTRPSPLWTRRN